MNTCIGRITLCEPCIFRLATARSPRLASPDPPSDAPPPQVGNKKDLDAEREVTFLEASRFAQENELMFLETSAMTGEHIEEAFLKCSNTILSKIETGEWQVRTGSVCEGTLILGFALGRVTCSHLNHLVMRDVAVTQSKAILC